MAIENEELPKEPAKAKIADRPHYVAIVLSVVAVILSLLSWWESHQNRRINEEINRPILSLTSMGTESQIFVMMQEGYMNHVGLFFTATLKNVGKSTAIIRKSTVTPTLSYPDDKCQIVKEESVSKQSDTGEPILIGNEEKYVGIINLTFQCEERKLWSIGVDVDMEYVDAGSGQSYSQQFHKGVDISSAQEKKKREAKEK